MDIIRSKRKIDLTELRNHLVKTSVKDDPVFNAMTNKERHQYFQENFADPEYRSDNWYRGMVPLTLLISNNTEFREEIFFDKGPTYVSQWPAIKAQFEELLDRWVLAKEGFSSGIYSPIVAREDNRKGLFRVWDGQRRTLNAFWHELPSIDAYIFIEQVPSAI